MHRAYIVGSISRCAGIMLSLLGSWCNCTSGKPYVHLREGIGDALDAGTGYESLSWLQEHEYNSITAVTMDPTLVAAFGSEQVQVLNLADEDTLAGEGYDVIIADYLLAAANAYEPFDPEVLLNKILGMLRPGGLLLLVGQELEDMMCGEGEGAKLFAELMRTRNQVPSLLEGRRPYRELPLSWVYRHLGAYVSADHQATHSLVHAHHSLRSHCVLMFLNVNRREGRVL
jgi:SAM-dependent methyltransferase